MQVRAVDNQVEWDNLLIERGGHPLQLWGWGELKSKHNWRAYRLVVEDGPRAVGAAQVLQRTMPWPFRSLLYVPRGPVGDLSVVLPALVNYLQEHFRSTHVVIEPHLTAVPSLTGWSRSRKAVLLARTAILDLERPEAELLQDMSKKTRQYIRKSARSGILVRRAAGEDIEACLSIYRQTAKRAKFSLHSDEYYYDIKNLLNDASAIYVAEFEGRVVAFLWLAVTPEVAFELYGGMSEVGQQLRANYYLKWRAIQDMKQARVKQYDMNGLLNDGVSNFKQGFVADETNLAGSYEYRLSIWYWPWKILFPAIKRSLQLISSLRN